MYVKLGHNCQCNAHALQRNERVQVKFFLLNLVHFYFCQVRFARYERRLMELPFAVRILLV